MKNRIALIGYRGTGKTTIGNSLIKRLGEYTFLDLDDYIVKKEKKSIPEIFNDFGEEKFREFENQYLKELSKNKNIVLSTGGGVVIREENRDILKKKYVNILLSCSPNVILKRIAGDKNRPALTSKSEYEEILFNLEKRDIWYKEVSNLMIQTDKYKVEECIEIILKFLNRV